MARITRVATITTITQAVSVVAMIMQSTCTLIIWTMCAPIFSDSTEADLASGSSITCILRRTRTIRNTIKITIITTIMVMITLTAITCEVSRGASHHQSQSVGALMNGRSQDTLGSVGVIISTLLIRFTGWTGFDPLASLFIAALIMASVIPLVVDAGRVLCLDVGSSTELDIRAALSDASVQSSHNLSLIRSSSPPSRGYRVTARRASGRDARANSSVQSMSS